MKENRNEIFQALADKLDEKDFHYNPAHWEAAEKMISSNKGFWSAKWVAGISTSILVGGVLVYGLLPQEEVNDNVAVVSERIVKQIHAPSKMEEGDVLAVVQEEEPSLIAVEDKTPKDEIHHVKMQEILAHIPKIEVEEEKQQVVETAKNTEEAVTEEAVDNDNDSDELTRDEYLELLELTGNPLKRMTPISDTYEQEEEVSESTEPEVEEVRSIEIPDIFTPNGDGINDYFYIKHLQGKDWNIYVYDQSNRLVFQSNDYDNKWDGGDLESGNYLYKLYHAETKTEFKGGFKLNR